MSASYRNVQESRIDGVCEKYNSISVCSQLLAMYQLKSISNDFLDILFKTKQLVKRLLYHFLYCHSHLKKEDKVSKSKLHFALCYYLQQHYDISSEKLKSKDKPGNNLERRVSVAAAVSLRQGTKKASLFQALDTLDKWMKLLEVAVNELVNLGVG